MERFNIVIVGHIDHGKSTLIGRLLYDTKTLAQERIDEIVSTCKALGREFEFAYILDAFREERQKEMTIDTTQVSFKTPKREYTIIDTPGHKELLRNMATGASYAQGAVLIVSTKEGIQEQTKRHAYILKLFGIKQIMRVRNEYYQILEDVQRCRLDVTQWFLWFIKCVTASIEHSQDLIGNVFMRVEFWNQHAQIEFNERQKKVLNRILEAGPGNFMGGLTTRKYVSITNVSRATAFREIADMLNKKVLRQLPGKGRSAHYDLVWPGWV